MRIRLWVFAILIVSAVVAAALMLKPRGSRPPRRIILIVVDTLRRDYLSCYGSPVSTPNIDRLAAGGQIFTNVAASFHQTTMSMAALFTGRTPSIESGQRGKPLHWNGRTWCGLARFNRNGTKARCIPRTVPTLAEAMRSAGYTTVGVASNELLFQPAGFDRGFDEWVEVGGQAAGAEFRSARDMWVARNADHVNQAVIEAVGRHQGEKLFLYIHYMDVHDWWIPGVRGHSYWVYPNYRRAVSAFDAKLGSLLRTLEGQGLLEDSVIFLTADHGEALGEKHPLVAGHTHVGNPSFEQLLRVPLIVIPGIFQDTTRFLRTEDIFELIRRLAVSTDNNVTSSQPKELFVGELFYQTYRRGRWKSTRRRKDGHIYLFDLKEDPGETRDVAAQHSDIVELHERRVEELTRILAAKGEQASSLSERDRQRLRALGYAQ